MSNVATKIKSQRQRENKSPIDRFSKAKEVAGMMQFQRCIFTLGDDGHCCGNPLETPEDEICLRCQGIIEKRRQRVAEQVVGTKRIDDATAVNRPGIAESRVKRINFRKIGGFITDF